MVEKLPEEGMFHIPLLGSTTSEYWNQAQKMKNQSIAQLEPEM